MHLDSGQGSSLDHSSHRPVVHEPLLAREARDNAHRWLARFAPLLDDLEALDAAGCRRRLDLTDELRPEGQAALLGLETQARAEDAELLTTLREAVRELEARESELRRRLGFLAPGDPAGIVDLDAIRERLAEAAARREIESLAPTGGTEALSRRELRLSSPNWGQSLMLGLFSLGILSFTTIHACFMIGGLFQVIGPFALALLLFYAMFWAPGLAMAVAAVRSGSSEMLELNGERLTLRRKYLGVGWARRYTLGPGSRAYLADASVRAGGSRDQEVAITDSEGREVRLAAGRPRAQQERLVEQLNEHLACVVRNT